MTQTNNDTNGVEPLEPVSKAMSDLLALAWACDLTRVASYQFSGSVGSTAYPMVGVSDNEHTMSHASGRADDINTCVRFCVKNFAYLLEKLKATPDGTGNLLDHSVLMLSSDVSQGWTHAINDYPILAAGRGRGGMKSPGIHYRAPNGRNTSDVVLSVMKAAGTGVSSVGGGNGYSNTPCAEILA